MKTGFTSVPGSLRRQILVFTMGMIVVCTLVIGSSFFAISKGIVRQNRIENTLSAIRHGAYTVEQDLDKIRELMDYFFVDKQIQAALAQDIRTEYDRTLQWNQLSEALSTYERLDYFRYINCVIFYSKDRGEEDPHVFRYMATDTRAYERRNLELGWYQSALDQEGRLLWGNTGGRSREDYEPYAAGTGQADISAMRALRDPGYKNIQGVAYVSIQPAYFSVMQENNGLDGMDVYLLDDAGRLLNPGGSEEEADFWLSKTADEEWQEENCRYSIADGKIVYECRIDSCGYRLLAVQPVMEAFLMDRPMILLGTIMLVMMALVALSLWIFLTRRVIRPVNALADTMSRVHTEGLSVRAPRTGSSEFVYLSDQLNYMLNQIQILMDRNLEKERAVQEAEHRAVLAQINPHFVYNALFAIRMMAMIQKADNIQGMVDALWRMLKNSTSRAKEDFSLGDEIQNVKDYIHILSATNVQKFEVIYEIAPELEQVLCPKFLIQPVVENAIMHGILPKSGFSTIEIRAAAGEEEVEITISNDGLPIPAERLAEVNQSLPKEAAAHKGLGISSIRRRLELLYGDRAELVITSSDNPEKTTVTIRYPLQKGEIHV